MKNIKLYAILVVIVVIIGSFAARFLNNHSFVSDKFIKQKNDSILRLKLDVAVLDSLAWSLQQDVDIIKANESKFQITIVGLSAENKRLRNAENTCCKELKHAEETGGIIRDTIKLNIWGKIKRKK